MLAACACLAVPCACAAAGGMCCLPTCAQELDPALGYSESDCTAFFQVPRHGGCCAMCPATAVVVRCAPPQRLHVAPQHPETRALYKMWTEVYHRSRLDERAKQVPVAGMRAPSIPHQQCIEQTMVLMESDGSCCGFGAPLRCSESRTLPPGESVNASTVCGEQVRRLCSSTIVGPLRR